MDASHSAQPFTSYLSTQHWSCVMCLSSVRLTLTAYSGEWRSFMSEEPLSHSLCVWNEIRAPADSVTVCRLSVASLGDRSRAPPWPLKRNEHRQSLAAVHSCKLHVSLSPPHTEWLRCCCSWSPSSQRSRSPVSSMWQTSALICLIIQSTWWLCSRNKAAALTVGLEGFIRVLTTQYNAEK